MRRVEGFRHYRSQEPRAKKEELRKRHYLLLLSLFHLGSEPSRVAN